MIPIVIPPIPHLETTAGRPMHLLLAHLMDDPAYVRFYRRERARGAYLILDNGAHEHLRGEDVGTLLLQSAQVEAQEVVLPDVLENASGTMEATIKAFWFLETQAGKNLLRQAWYPNLMVVPQGGTPREFRLCLDELLRAYGAFIARSDGEYTPHITIGVSKDYETWEGGLYTLLEETVIPCANDYHARIHLLGWGRDLWAYRKIVTTFEDRIRSCDTAKPYVYASRGIVLDPMRPAPVYPKRAPEYFATPLDVHAAVIVRNVRVFDDMIKGEFL